MYRVRQTGFFAFVLGVLVSDNKWVVLGFFVFFAGLWLWSVYREDQEKQEDVEIKFASIDDDIPTTRFAITYKELREMPSPNPIDLLLEKGFDPRLPFTYYDDPISEQRIYTQEKMRCTCRSGPNGKWVVGRACPYHGVG